jgi:molybdate transport system substrate-binding protein
VTLRFVSAGAAQGLVRAIASAAGTAIDGRFGAVGAMMELLRSGEPCDVVILTRAQIARLATEGALPEDSIRDVGSVATSVAVRSGAAPPSVGDEAALRDALLAADALYFPDPVKATAGVHFASVLERLGISAKVADRLKTFPNGATAMAELARAPGRPIGCTQATEILATPGVSLVAPLPEGFDLHTVYTAAVHGQAADARGARDFIARLTGAENAETRRKAGFAKP